MHELCVCLLVLVCLRVVVWVGGDVCVRVCLWPTADHGTPPSTKGDRYVENACGSVCLGCCGSSARCAVRVCAHLTRLMSGGRRTAGFLQSMLSSVYRAGAELQQDTRTAIAEQVGVGGWVGA